MQKSKKDLSKSSQRQQKAKNDEKITKKGVTPNKRKET
jgi:hypothetical protein